MARITSRDSAGTTRRRAPKLTATLVAVGLGAASVAAFASAGPAGAAGTYTSYGAGRFLNGTIGSTSLDTVAGIAGVEAKNTTGQTVTAGPDSLNAELLNGAIDLPLKNGLQLTGLNVAQLGAVSQYATANGDGSALGASGAILSNGGIALGGTDGAPANASLDLSGLGGAAVADTLGNLKLNLGAISGQAKQATGASGAQTGAYQIANLNLQLTSPVLGQTLSSTFSTVESLLQGLGTSINNLNLGVVQITGLSGLPDVASDLGNLTIAQGVTLDLATGGITVDLGALLESLGLNLNALPADSSLIPFIVTALGNLPNAVGVALQNVLSQVNTAIGGIGLALGVCATPPVASATCTILSPGTLTAPVTGVLTTLLSSVTTALNGATTQVTSALTPLTNELTSLIKVCVNQQGGASAPAPHDADCAVTDPVPAGEFVERAIEVDLLGDSGVNLDLAQAAVGPSAAVPGTPSTSPTGTPSPSPTKTTLASTGASVQGLWLGGLAMLCLGLALMVATWGKVGSVRFRQH